MQTQPLPATLDTVPGTWQILYIYFELQWQTAAISREEALTRLLAVDFMTQVSMAQAEKTFQQHRGTYCLRVTAGYQFQSLSDMYP